MLLKQFVCSQYFDHCTFHDYNDGFISIHDLRNVNIVDFVAAANLMDARDMFAVAFVSVFTN